MVVTSLYRDSPAASAGVRPGDIVVAIDGADVANAQDALKQMALRKPGGSVKLKVQRGTRQLEIECKVAERPAQT